MPVIVVLLNKDTYRCHLSSNLDVDAFVERSGLDAIIQPSTPVSLRVSKTSTRCLWTRVVDLQFLYNSGLQAVSVQEWSNDRFLTIVVYRLFLYKSSPLTVSSQ